MVGLCLGFTVLCFSLVAYIVWQQLHFYECEKNYQFQIKDLLNHIVAKNVGELKYLTMPPPAPVANPFQQFAEAGELLR